MEGGGGKKMLSSSKRCHSNTEEMRALFAASIRGRKAPVGLHRYCSHNFEQKFRVMENIVFSKNNMFKKNTYF